jgi:hypothetical protein
MGRAGSISAIKVTLRLNQQTKAGFRRTHDLEMSMCSLLKRDCQFARHRLRGFEETLQENYASNLYFGNIFRAMWVRSCAEI